MADRSWRLFGNHHTRVILTSNNSIIPLSKARKRHCWIPCVPIKFHCHSFNALNSYCVCACGGEGGDPETQGLRRVKATRYIPWFHQPLAGVLTRLVTPSQNNPYQVHEESSCCVDYHPLGQILLPAGQHQGIRINILRQIHPTSLHNFA